MSTPNRANSTIAVIAVTSALLACGTSPDAAPGTTPPVASTAASVSPTTTAPTVAATTSPDETGPPPGDGALLVLGDWGAGTAEQEAVAAAMASVADSTRVEAVLTTGDNFYSDDTDELMAPVRWVADRGIEWWVTWGNHDIETETRIAAVDDAFGRPPRWDIRRWGDIDVIILDSNRVVDDQQLAFFTAAMTDSDRPTIVAFHHPGLSCSRHGENAGVIERWVPLFDDDVVLVVTGHDHNYQRFEVDGVTHLVVGNGGRHLYGLETCGGDHPPMLAGTETHGFVVLEATDGAITVTALDADGAEIDRVDIALP